MANCNIICNYPFKNHVLAVFMMVLCFISNVQAQYSSDTDSMPGPVHPSKLVVIVTLSILFTLSFFLLLYIRIRKSTTPEIINIQNSHHSPNFQALTRSRSRSRLSGIDREVIEALPFFRFSSLKGSKQGLECTVCLSQFEDTEILRLLPKCKHAFHMNCIDKWLENHSSCPLCRNKVDPLDIKNFTNSISSRFLRVPSNLTEDTNLQIFVHRDQPSSRFNIGSRFWNFGRSNKEENLIDQEDYSSTQVHKFNHKIVVSDVVTRSRWSDLNSSDMLSLKSEMIHDMSSRRFSPSNEIMFHGNSSVSSILNEDKSSFTLLNRAEKRSMSEIAHVPRFIETSSGDNEREERLRRTWLQIAQRTVQWFGDKKETQEN